MKREDKKIFTKYGELILDDDIDLAVIDLPNGDQYSMRVTDDSLIISSDCFEAVTITKQPSQPTIIKSGDTWVAEYDGVDYLLLDPKKFHGVAKDIQGSVFIKQAFPKDKHDVSCWKPISEIEITDDIARLRPMVTGKYSENKIILYGVSEHKLVFLNIKGCKENYRLATVKDLKNV